MTDDQLLKRPVGWWLKEADARLDAAFDAALAGRDVDRRGWQVLASLARGSTPRRDLVGRLSPFDEPARVGAVVDALIKRGWVGEAQGVLQLTSQGATAQAALAPLVDQVRSAVAQALPGDDYVTLVRLLARLVAALPETSG